MGPHDQREPGAHHHIAHMRSRARLGACLPGGGPQSIYRGARPDPGAQRQTGHSMTQPAALLQAVDLAVSYRQQRGWQSVLSKVNFTIGRGEALGLVGESGCGKSTVALQLLGYRHPASRVDGGQVLFDGQDLLSLRRRDLDCLRGNRISFVPQNPTTALNPGIRVGPQVVETLLTHGKANDNAAGLERAIELFTLVGLPQPALLVRRYPPQLSGGQHQRVFLALALARSP